MPRKAPAVTVAPPDQKAVGGGLEGAERTTRELALWDAPIISPDRQINPVKDLADARSRDSVQNDGYAMGALNTYRDSIVGSQFRLNAQPEVTVLSTYNKGFDESWEEEFQLYVESRFNLLAESQECWFDASRMNTLTDLVRLGVCSDLMHGEVLCTVEWIRASLRPFQTAIQLINPTRLSNPNGEADTRYLRRGVVKDRFGQSLGFHIRRSFPNDYFDAESNQWTYVPARKPWGRLQVIHIVQQMQADQSRGISDIVSVLKNMKMTRKFRDIVLQNAVINASYAAAIESELPREMIFGAMGAGQSGLAQMLKEYMTALGTYVSQSDNIAIDGAKIPHLFPGTKLSLTPMGTPGGIGSEFEISLLRHTAAALGLSYEQFAHDYTKTNYSSARASMGETEKRMKTRKKVCADSLASSIFTLWLEEDINAGNVPLPNGVGSEIFYDPVMREALVRATWIGSGRPQVDEKKETEAAVMRMDNNLTTLEEECGRLGSDWRRVLRQKAREKKMKDELGLTPPPSTNGQGGNQPANQGDNSDDESGSQQGASDE